MKFLILGDLVGSSGRKALNKYLKEIIDAHRINFTVLNGENAADDGHGIPKDIANEFFTLGVDVITSGNHIWDKEETTTYIDKENRLLRPANLVNGSPGKGFGVFLSKDKKYKIGVINLMGNVFMRKTEDVFTKAKDHINILECVEMLHNRLNVIFHTGSLALYSLSFSSIP